jgi:quercetin dioxygenase-like cupin family protein
MTWWVPPPTERPPEHIHPTGARTQVLEGAFEVFEINGKPN